MNILTLQCEQEVLALPRGKVLTPDSSIGRRPKLNKVALNVTCCYGDGLEQRRVSVLDWE